MHKEGVGGGTDGTKDSPGQYGRLLPALAAAGGVVTRCAHARMGRSVDVVAVSR